MFYIVGLGNPGKEYENTRHNVGFILVQQLIVALGFSSFYKSSTQSGLVSEGSIEDTPVTALLPTTFMNNVGSAVVKLVAKGEESKLIVVYDDIDLPFGSIRISVSRGDGGHNGIKSIIAKLGTQDFIRIRVGIAKKSFWTGQIVRPKGEKLASFVLAQLSRSEENELELVGKKVTDAVQIIIKEGVQKAMNHYN
jgi:peptidyl-tRNA hydrolase, PTH1 family